MNTIDTLRQRETCDNGERYGEFCWCILDYEGKVVERDDDCKVHKEEEE